MPQCIGIANRTEVRVFGLMVADLDDVAARGNMTGLATSRTGGRRE